MKRACSDIAGMADATVCASAAEIPPLPPFVKGGMGGFAARCSWATTPALMIWAGLLVALTLCALPAQAFNLGKELEKQLGGDKPGSALGLGGYSEQEEIAIGRQIAGNILGAAPLVKDDKLQQYVNRVGRWVASQSERPDLPWHFGVIDSNDINAFAAPGGYVFVTKGLYRQLGSEAELAGVLGHEIGHVIRKHHLKILQKSQFIELGGKLLSKQVGDNANVQKLIGTGAEISARALDKDAEFEADRIAVVLARRAGYDPFGLPNVLQEIAHVSKDEGSVALLFKTHPHPNERLDQLGQAIGERLDGVKGKSVEKRLYRLK